MTLFDTFQAAARSGDPDTSHAAARSVKNTALVRGLILDVLERFGPLTDQEIEERYTSTLPVSPSGLRTRRSELVADGQVVDSGERRRLRSGRLAIVWSLVADSTTK